MESAKKQYSYFENLESTVRIAFAIYLVIFVVGMILTLLGVQYVIAFLHTHNVVFSLLAVIFILAIFTGLIYIIGKINWLGDLHIQLDKRFFGFLEKSNEGIFRTLISALTPD